MTAQTWNKITTAVGSDGWNPVVHMKGLADTADVVINVASAAERDGLAALAPGGALPNPTHVCRTDTVDQRIETWNGSAWVTKKGIAYTPIWTGAINYGVGGSMTGTYWLDGDRVTVRAKVISGAGASLGSAVIGFPLPAGLPIAAGLVLGTGAFQTVGGVIRVLHCYASGTGACSVWAPNNPIATPGTAGYPFDAGDLIEAVVTYQTTTP